MAVGLLEHFVTMYVGNVIDHPFLKNMLSIEISYPLTFVLLIIQNQFFYL